MDHVKYRGKVYNLPKGVMGGKEGEPMKPIVGEALEQYLFQHIINQIRGEDFDEYLVSLLSRYKSVDADRVIKIEITVTHNDGSRCFISSEKGGNKIEFINQ